MKKHFFTSGSKVGGTRTIGQSFTILKPRDCSQSFPDQISNQVLKQLVCDWEDCQKSIIAYDRDIPRVSFLPSIPQYKHKICTGNLFSSDNQSIEKRGINPNNRLLHLSQSDIIISTKSQDVIKVRVVPATAIYFFEVAHQKPVTLVDLNYHLRAGIDLGIDRLVALAPNNPTFTPTIYDKKHLKSINQGFNQRRAFLLSNIARIKSTAGQIQQITFNRNKRLEKYFCQTIGLIVKQLVDEKIIQLIIGTNAVEKQNIKLEKKLHVFVVIPYAQLVKFITCKAELVGIKLIVTEASYTNNCRFWDLEPVGKQESYQGKSGKRGWFRSGNESRINADVNAALNMIRKVNVNSPP
ncbi:transposase [Oscillatoria nigro-viridis]|uniref:transposase n=1 Tax=Phormidium nigroviride TaxID=482564 RepID=UPI0003086D02|nr:transposase [Oscillatoria nigro-viridis]